MGDYLSQNLNFVLLLALVLVFFLIRVRGYDGDQKRRYILTVAVGLTYALFRYSIFPAVFPAQPKADRPMTAEKAAALIERIEGLSIPPHEKAALIERIKNRQ